MLMGWCELVLGHAVRLYTQKTLIHSANVLGVGVDQALAKHLDEGTRGKRRDLVRW